jgi:hypothetical protein
MRVSAIAEIRYGLAAAFVSLSGARRADQLFDVEDYPAAAAL